MQETQSVEETRIVAVPNLVRSRFLLVLGWALLILSVALLTVHVIWMWKRMGTGAPLVGIGLVIDALVGLGMIIAGVRVRRKK
jgi:hypothetical protein